jgi:hypothetical protein
MIAREYQGLEGIQKAMNELAAKMLEHGRDHWPKWTVDRLAKAATGQPPEPLVAVFTEIRRAENLLEDLKKEWLPRNRKKGYPISLVITGLFDDTHALCRKTGFKEHTYLHCLGPFGRQAQQLPSGDEFSLITMCGHGLIAKNRVRRLVQGIQKGEVTPEQAAEDIARPCECGIGNKKRAQELFARLAKKSQSG